MSLHADEPPERRERLDSSGGEISVRGWRTTIFIVATIAAGVGIVLGIAAAKFVRVGADVYGYAGGILLAMGVAAWFLYSLWKSSIREVVVKDSGLLLRTGKEVIEVRWGALLPFRYPVFLGEIGLEFRVTDSFGPDSVKAINLTPRQAVAIVSHRSYPYPSVPQIISQSLGLRSDGRLSA